MKGKKRISLLAVLVCVFALVFSLGILSACGSTDDQAAANQWYYGAEAPADTLGNEGDYYLNTKTLASYVKSESGTWTETAANWYYGTEEPVANLGAQNDFYLNTETGALYQKGAETWGSPILTLKGEQGKPGRDGVLWFSGKAVPEIDAPELKDAIVGDFYLDTADFTVWQRTETEWAELGSIKPADGRDGSKWFYGKEAVESAALEDAIVGDFYMRYFDEVDGYTGYQIFTKEESGWNKTIDNTVCKINHLEHQFGEDNLCVNCGYENIFAPSEFHEDSGSDYIIKGAPEGVTELEIPGTINGKQVKIGEKAFGGSAAYDPNPTLQKVVIGEGVTEIGNNAFSWCTNLREVELPESLTKIGSSAFWSCPIEEIEIGNVTSIGNSAFTNSGLKKVAFGDGLQTIGINVFTGCSDLAEVIFGEGVQLKSIPYGSFNGCGSLRSIDLPETVTSIGDYAFLSCGALESIDLKNVTTIGESGFQSCSSLSTVELPKATSIGTNAFRESTAISKVTFGAAEGGAASLSIGGAAFFGCTNLTTVTFHMKTITFKAFSNFNSSNLTFNDCISLHTFVFGGTMDEWLAVKATFTGNWIYNTNTDKQIEYSVTCTDGSVDSDGTKHPAA